MNSEQCLLPSQPPNVVESPTHWYDTGTTQFVAPKNPGAFLTNVKTNLVDQLSQIAEHKQNIIKYETYKDCLYETQSKIINVINPNVLHVF